MADVQLLQIEIQNLKDALETSQKKSDRYFQLVTTLSDELNKLRSNICNDCKKRFVPGNLLNVSSTSTSTPFWRRMFRNRQHRLPSRSAFHMAGSSHTSNSASFSSTPTISLITSETIPGITVDTSATNPGSEQSPISPKPEGPKFSVEYNPEVKRALILHLEHVFAYESPAYRMKISPDGQRMAVGFHDNGATIISDMKTRLNVRVFVDRYVKDKLWIQSVKFSPDGRLLATVTDDHKIRICDITQNRMRAMFKRHRDEVNSIAFSPDGRFLVSASDDGSVRIWNIRDGSSNELPATDDHHWFFSVVFSPDGRYIAAGEAEYSLWIWDSRTHKLVANWIGGHWVRCVKFTPDGKGLMSGSRDMTVKYWDVSSLGDGAASGREVVNPKHSFPLIRTFPGHTRGVWSIAFFPSNDEWIITGSGDGSVRVWDIRTGIWQLVVLGHQAAVLDVDVCGTENFLATASQDGHVTLWRYEVL